MTMRFPILLIVYIGLSLEGVTSVESWQESSASSFESNLSELQIRLLKDEPNACKDAAEKSIAETFQDAQKQQKEIDDMPDGAECANKDQSLIHGAKAEFDTAKIHAEFSKNHLKE